MRYLLIALTSLLTSCSFVDKLVLSNLYPFKIVDEEFKVNLPAVDMREIVLPNNVIAWVYEEPASKAALVVAHGNGENLETLNQVGFLNALKKLKVSFIIFDYPGLGKSQGTPNEESVRLAAMNALLWADRQWTKKTIVLMGRSLGAAAVLQAAVSVDQNAFDAIILISPWATMKLAAANMNKLAKKMSDRFMRAHEYDNVRAAKSITTTAIVLHGDKDELILPSHGLQTADALAANFVLIKGFEHNDIFNSSLFWQQLNEFIRGVE